MNQTFPAHLSSARLLLRRLERDDVAALHGYRSLSEVARFQSWESFSVEDAARLIAGQSGQEPGVPGTWLQLAIVEQGSGRMVGDCGLHCLRDDRRQMELGVTLSPSHQRRGYATEALKCVLDFVFGALDMHRVSATTDVENHAAASLFLGLGFQREAHFVEHRWYKGNWASEFVFAILKREWKEMKEMKEMKEISTTSVMSQRRKHVR